MSREQKSSLFVSKYDEGYIIIIRQRENMRFRLIQ